MRRWDDMFVLRQAEIALEGELFAEMDTEDNNETWERAHDTKVRKEYPALAGLCDAIYGCDRRLLLDHTDIEQVYEDPLFYDEKDADLKEQVIRFRFGFVDGEKWTLMQIADASGLSYSRVRNLLNEALTELKTFDPIFGVNGYCAESV